MNLLIEQETRDNLCHKNVRPMIMTSSHSAKYIVLRFSYTFSKKKKDFHTQHTLKALLIVLSLI
jgi:hypothetical protein